MTGSKGRGEMLVIVGRDKIVIGWMTKSETVDASLYVQEYYVYYLEDAL